MYKIVLFLHILAATIWTGGHLVLALSVLPKAFKQKSVAILSEYEANFEKIGIPALLVQVLSGFWMAYHLVPNISSWFTFGSPKATLVFVKMSLLLLTVGLALDARLRIIPKLDESNMKSLAYHIVPVTLISILFVYVGVSFRTGSLFG